MRRRSRSDEVEVSAPAAPVGPPRVTPGDRSEVGLRTWGFSQVAARVQGIESAGIFLTLGRHRRLYRGWMNFAARLMPFGRLPRRETELVILRVAHLRGCAYEWHHHVHLGRRAGVSSTDVARLQKGSEETGWSARERAILRAVDALDADGDLDDSTWDDLRVHLDERTAIELLMLVGHYEMLATTLITLRVAPDERRSRRSSGSAPSGV